MSRLHLMRNRVAHHEQIHRRNVAADYADLLYVARAICPQASAWIEQTSTVQAVLAQRPIPPAPTPLPGQ
jgi:hypothetical protein